MRLTPGIARIHAHICGDGCVYISREKRSLASLIKHPRKKLDVNQYIIEYYNKCNELLNEFKKDMEKEFSRKASYSPKKFRLRIRGAKHIIEKLEVQSKNSRNWVVPNYISSSSLEIIKNWLRAFFDDESTVDVQRKRIRVKLMNKLALIQISFLLSKLKIDSRITGQNIDGSWYLNVPKDYLRTYQMEIGFLHPQKKDKLEKVVGRGGFSKIFEPPTPRSSAVCSPRLSYRPLMSIYFIILFKSFL